MGSHRQSRDGTMSFGVVTLPTRSALTGNVTAARWLRTSDGRARIAVCWKHPHAAEPNSLPQEQSGRRRCATGPSRPLYPKGNTVGQGGVALLPRQERPYEGDAPYSRTTLPPLGGERDVVALDELGRAGSRCTSRTSCHICNEGGPAKCPQYGIGNRYGRVTHQCHAVGRRRPLQERPPPQKSYGCYKSFATRPRGHTMAPTDKPRRFIEEHLIDQNATQAAIWAGCRAKSASRIGSEQLGKPVLPRRSRPLKPNGLLARASRSVGCCRSAPGTGSPTWRTP